MAGNSRLMAPADLDTSSGCVVITRFECRSVFGLLYFIALHARLQHAVRKDAGGYVGSCAVVLWGSRTLLSISLWADLKAVYSMGNVSRHIEAARLPRRLGIATNCGIYGFAGDWRRVMFGTECESRSPIRPIESTPQTRPHPMNSI